MSFKTILTSSCFPEEPQRLPAHTCSSSAVPVTGNRIIEHIHTCPECEHVTFFALWTTFRVTLRDACGWASVLRSSSSLRITRWTTVIGGCGPDLERWQKNSINQRRAESWQLRNFRTEWEKLAFHTDTHLCVFSLQKTAWRESLLCLTQCTANQSAGSQGLPECWGCWESSGALLYKAPEVTTVVIWAIINKMERNQINGTDSSLLFWHSLRVSKRFDCFYPAGL